MTSKAAALLTMAFCVTVLHGQTAPPPPPAAAGDLEVIQLRPNFFMIAGAGGNIAVQTGEDGLLVTDTGLASHAAAVLAAIRKISPAPIR
jgi:hypothetical protein